MEIQILHGITLCLISSLTVLSRRLDIVLSNVWETVLRRRSCFCRSRDSFSLNNPWSRSAGRTKSRIIYSYRCNNPFHYILLPCFRLSITSPVSPEAKHTVVLRLKNKFFYFSSHWNIVWNLHKKCAEENKKGNWFSVTFTTRTKGEWLKVRENCSYVRTSRPWRFFTRKRIPSDWVCSLSDAATREAKAPSRLSICTCRLLITSPVSCLSCSSLLIDSISRCWNCNIVTICCTEAWSCDTVAASTTWTGSDLWRLI